MCRVKLKLYYTYREGPSPIYGGCYFSWVSLLAIIPSNLSNYRWRVYQASTDVIQIVIEGL